MMVTKWRDWWYGKERKLEERAFQPNCFLENEWQQFFNRHGYYHLKDGLPAASLRELLTYHDEIKHDSRYISRQEYFSSFSFPNRSFVAEIRMRTREMLQAPFEKLCDARHFNPLLGGGYCINPPHSGAGCFPHQDPSSTDEAQSYSLSMWIALTDMDAARGCLHIVPGSHRWGNRYRSINHYWPFQPHLAQIQSLLVPVPMKAGDILFFDLATIHTSPVNTTQFPRIGLNVPLLSTAKSKWVCYPENKNLTAVYEVDDDFFLIEDELRPPPSRYRKIKTVESPYYSANNIAAWQQQYLQELP